MPRDAGRGGLAVGRAGRHRCSRVALVSSERRADRPTRRAVGLDEHHRPEESRVAPHQRDRTVRLDPRRA